MNEKPVPTCPRCGTELRAGPAGGVCPRCAAAFLQGSPTEASAEGQGRHAFIPPSVAELAQKLNQLEILGFLGQGGMGAVYIARQRELDRVVALKILPLEADKAPAFSDRFTREAKALARLNHAGIVTIYDFGHVDGLFYFLMEYVDGVSLAQLMRHGRMSPREALAVVPQICDALQYAHDQGLVHRDIKPENILLDRRGRVKVADFGLAKIVGCEDAPVSGDTAKPSASLTDPGKVMGTPSYMSPEQKENPAEVDHRADIYALGVVFYQMLTGELPGKPLAPPSRKVQVDVRLDEVVLKALEKEPQRRYQQASEVKTAVETLNLAARQAEGGGWRQSRAPRKRIFAGPLAAATMLVLVGVGLLGMWRAARLDGPGPAVTPPTTFSAIPAEQGDKVQEEVLSRQEPAKAKNQAASDEPRQIPQWATVKSLREWIGDLKSPDPSTKKLAERAIAALGTNALPEFLKVLTDPDPTSEAKDRRYDAAAALRFIGPGVGIAIPSFVSLLGSGNGDSAYTGASALAFVTPVVPEAFTPLTNGLVDSSPSLRDAATYGMSLLLGSESNHFAESALPMLLQNLKDGADYIRADTASALMNYVQAPRRYGPPPDPDLIIPAVLKLLQDNYSFAREYAFRTIMAFGDRALPVLRNLMNDSDSQIRECAASALRGLGDNPNGAPEAQTGHGN